MLDSHVRFSAEELLLMQDAELMRSRRSILGKIQELLGRVQQALVTQMSWSGFPWESEIRSRGAKISKGDNYLDMPYLVLDYPRCYGTEDVFAFRVMFWWGHGFSAFLHLKGYPLDYLADRLYQRWPQFQATGILVSHSLDEWVQHPAPDHFMAARDLDRPEPGMLHRRPFLKLGRTLELTAWNSMEEFSVQTLQLLLGDDA